MACTHDIIDQKTLIENPQNKIQKQKTKTKKLSEIEQGFFFINYFMQ